MKQPGGKLLPLCMLLLLSAGALMPHGAAALQDRRLTAQAASRPLESVEFTLNQDGGVKETLSLLSGGYTQVPLQAGVRLTQEEAEEAARDAAELLMQEGLVPEFPVEAPAGSIVFAALSKSDSSNSAVIWSYTFLDPQQSRCTVWIDDASGKLVSVSYVENVDAATSTGPTVAPAAAVEVAHWAMFLEGYYGFNLEAIEEDSDNTFGHMFSLEFLDATESAATTFQLPMLFLGNDFFFC